MIAARRSQIEAKKDRRAGFAATDMSRPFRLCYITDRNALKPENLSWRIREAVRAGVDLIQIREKDLPTRDLAALVHQALETARGTSTRILVNDRLDVAIALGAAGVHLGTQSIPVDTARRIVPKGFLIGASCHSIGEAEAAQAAGADYIVFGPVFKTASKLQYGPPVGLEKLREAAAKISIPVLALGGITPNRVKSCLDAGAAGIAGISIFQSCPSLPELVSSMTSSLDGP
jgi:thiamine-phosphate pyrophosphorylase